MADRLRSSSLAWLRTPSTPSSSPTGPTAPVACSTASLPQPLQTSWKPNLLLLERPAGMAWWPRSCRSLRPQQKSGSYDVTMDGVKSLNLTPVWVWMLAEVILRVLPAAFVTFSLHGFLHGIFWDGRKATLRTPEAGQMKTQKLNLPSAFYQKQVEIPNRSSRTCSKHSCFFLYFLLFFCFSPNRISGFTHT